MSYTQCWFPFIVYDYPATHFEALITHLYQPLPSIILLSSHVLWPTHHLQDTTLWPFLPFLDPFFLASVPLCHPSTTPTLHTFMLLTQWSTSYPPLFVGKMHQVMSCLVYLAVDLIVLHLLAYPCNSKIVFGVTQPVFRTSHSIKEAQQPPTLLWSLYYAYCQCKVKCLHVFAQSHNWEQVAPLMPKLMP
jgi:hypothetical protein